MRSMLLAAAGSLAVTCLAAAPAQAQQTFARGFFAPPSARTPDSQFSTRLGFGHDGFFIRSGSRSWDDGHGHGWHDGDGHSCMDRDHCRRDDRRDRDRSGHTDVVLENYGGEWALYNNRTFDPDSYNDWWHDRPDRSMPRWVTHNEGCARMWYAGDTLRC